MNVNVTEPGVKPYDHIRQQVAKLCSAFSGEYWRDLDRKSAYPAEFVETLTNDGYLAALIPERYGGSGLPLAAAAAILEEILRAGCSRACALYDSEKECGAEANMAKALRQNRSRPCGANFDELNFELPERACPRPSAILLR